MESLTRDHVPQGDEGYESDEGRRDEGHESECHQREADEGEAREGYEGECHEGRRLEGLPNLRMLRALPKHERRSLYADRPADALRVPSLASDATARAWAGSFN